MRHLTAVLSAAAIVLMAAGVAVRAMNATNRTKLLRSCWNGT